MAGLTYRSFGTRERSVSLSILATRNDQLGLSGPLS
jgi:hypothetical protein